MKRGSKLPELSKKKSIPDAGNSKCKRLCSRVYYTWKEQEPSDRRLSEEPFSSQELANYSPDTASFVDKVLLAPSHVHSFICWLLLCYSKRQVVAIETLQPANLKILINRPITEKVGQCLFESRPLRMQFPLPEMHKPCRLLRPEASSVLGAQLSSTGPSLTS